MGTVSTLYCTKNATNFPSTPGHEGRVLNLKLSPDGSTVATVAGDETVRLWKSFELDPVKKKAKERMVKSTSSIDRKSVG